MSERKGPKMHEMEIKNLIIDGFQASMNYGEMKGVGPSQFSEWARHAILSIFLGCQDIGEIGLTSEIRRANLERNLGDFVAASRAFYAQYLIDEENSGRVTPHLRSLEKR